VKKFHHFLLQFLQMLKLDIGFLFSAELPSSALASILLTCLANAETKVLIEGQQEGGGATKRISNQIKFAAIGK